MLIKSLTSFIEKYFPKESAADYDNPGLQVGNTNNEIKNILICLDFNYEILKEAIAKNCNLIISHHPFLFRPIKSIPIGSMENADLIANLIKNDITLYSMHTNFDFGKDGVSFQLAKKLRLKNIKFLEKLDNKELKIAVFVPIDKLDSVSDAVFNAGAGIIGDYSKCSYRSNGSGTFMGSELSNPAYGKKLNFEKVEEVKLEFQVNDWNLNKVINAMIKAHPYEEPAYDIYSLKNSSSNYGIGSIGDMENALDESDFLNHVAKLLGSNNLRFTSGKNKKIKKVAVCGGTCSELFIKAISAGADAFITADIKYHTFQEAQNKILLIDAGHYETEIHSLSKMKNLIENHFDEEKSKSKIIITKKITNPIKYYNLKGALR